MSFRSRTAFALSASVISLAPFTFAPAYAQSAEQGEPSEQSDSANQATTDEIIVRGIRNALRSELEKKRAANRIVDGISAEDIGKLPDENVTEAIQRIPGVQIERDAGEGTSVSVRGLPQNRVEVGGLRLVSPIGRQETGNPEEVSVIQVVPSALLSRIQVSKSPTASQVEGSLGGTVELELRKPLDLGNKVVYGLGGRIDERAGKLDPQGDITASIVSSDKRFGFLVAATYQERSLLSGEFNARSGWRDDAEGGQDYSSVIEMRFQEKAEDRKRFGISSIAQFRPDDTLEIYLTGLYSDFSIDRQRDWFSYSASASDRPSYYVDGTVVLEQDRTRPDVQNILGGEFLAQAQNNAEDYTDTSASYNGSAGFRKDAGRLTVEGQVSYGYADRDTFQNFLRFRENNVGFVKDFTTDIPTLFLTGDFDPTDLSEYTGSIVGFVQEFRYFSDETVAQLDLEYELDGFLTSIEAGARFTDQSSTRESYRSRMPGFDPAVSTGGSSNYTISMADFFNEFGTGGTRIADLTDTFGGGNTVDSFIAPDPTTLGAERLLELGGRAGGQTVFDPFTSYITKETIYSGYGMANFSGNGFSGNIGLRILHTKQDSSGFAFDPLQDINAPVSFQRDYTNLLPSANVVIELNNDLYLRLAASRVLSRPSTADLSFSTSVNTITGTGAITSADRDPLVADALDASLEYYINDTSSIAVAAFYKDVTAYPASVTACEQIAGLPNLDDQGDADPSNDTQRTCASFGPDFFEIERTANADGKIWGAEFQASYTFENGFGGRFNYTYIGSESPFVDPATGSPIGLPNLSKHSLNVVVFYENGPFGARVAYNWRDAYLRNVNFTASNSLSQEASGQLDASISYDLNKSFSLNASISNITDEYSKVYNLNEQRPLFYNDNGRRFFFGLRGRF